MYIVSFLDGGRITKQKRRCAPVAQGVAVRRMRCTVLPPLEAPTRLAVTSVSIHCAAYTTLNQQQDSVTDTRCVTDVTVPTGVRCRGAVRSVLRSPRRSPPYGATSRAVAAAAARRLFCHTFIDSLVFFVSLR